MLSNTHRILFCAIAGLSATSLSFAGDGPKGRDGMKDKDHAAKHEAKYDGDRMKPHDAVLHEAFGLHVRPLERQTAASRDIKPGVGLVVEDVKAGSLAAKGGLQNGDVIFQVGDQWVINPGQLATLLSIQDADDDFEIKVYRGTDRVDLDYEFDQTALDTMNRGFDAPAMGSVDQQTDRDLTRGDMPRDDMAGLDRNPMIIPETFDFSDDLHSISIRTDDGVKKLTVKDKDNNVLFDGPYNSATDREKLPADIKAKVERVLREKVK